AASICALCQQHGVPLSYLEFSFAEQDFGSNPVPLRQLMNKLMKRGFRVSVDRFGFGESPLKHIISVPANSIKLSDDFLGYNSRVLYTNTIIKHFVSMMKEMGFGISCGGVQTQKQLELLQNVGCEQAQGSYYAEPMTAEQFELRYLD
ncbi:MAG: EAL domain-containing protein, partial [Clostridiales bacterium]|nr:EAL domain-containing protein [Clostridiales bacterium]